MLSSRVALTALLSTLVLLATSGSAVGQARRSKILRASLAGRYEVPAISTPATGRFTARFVPGTGIQYELTYSGLRGTATFAHIHFGQPGVNGGVAAFLAGGGGAPDAPPSGTVSGVIEAADVVGPAGQGIAPGDMEALMAAINGGVAYVNVHSDLFPGGEIRGQINGGKYR